MSLLELKNITYNVDGLQIIDGVSLSLEEGMMIVLTGPNGGGKTSLAKLIMGIAKPTSGQILFDGKDVTEMEVFERAQLGISYAFQHPTRIKGINIGEMLSMSAGESLSKINACKYLTDVGLCANDYIDRELNSSLSGGEMKRIEIASVLARASKLNVFDEPEAGIDLWSFAKLTETFKELREKRNSGIIIISHQERILELADQIVVISGGKVQLQGSKEQVFPKIMGEVQYNCSFMERVAQ